MDKPTIIIHIEPSGDPSIRSNIGDLLLIRNTLRLVEESITVNALKAASPEQKMVVPAHAIPKIIKPS